MSRKTNYLSSQQGRERHMSLPSSSRNVLDYSLGRDVESPTTSSNLSQYESNNTKNFNSHVVNKGELSSSLRTQRGRLASTTENIKSNTEDSDDESHDNDLEPGAAENIEFQIDETALDKANEDMYQYTIAMLKLLKPTCLSLIIDEIPLRRGKKAFMAILYCVKTSKVFPLFLHVENKGKLDLATMTHIAVNKTHDLRVTPVALVCDASHDYAINCAHLFVPTIVDLAHWTKGIKNPPLTPATKINSSNFHAILKDCERFCRQTNPPQYVLQSIYTTLHIAADFIEQIKEEFHCSYLSQTPIEVFKIVLNDVTVPTIFFFKNLNSKLQHIIPCLKDAHIIE